MNDRIKVHVVKYADCVNQTLRYKDPMTGKQVRRSAGTTNKREARKLSAVWESELNSGKSQATGNIRWEEFRIRYESEVVSGLAEKTACKIDGVFNVLEAALPKVADGKLRDLTSARISRLHNELRSKQRAESTISGHRAHLPTALQWAVDMGMIASVPKIKRPRRAKKAGATTPMKGRPITAEELERVLGKVTEVIFGKPKADEAAKGKPAKPTPKLTPEQRENRRTIAETWKHLLRGLWWSGLRIGEATDLYWDRPDRICVDLTGRRPMLRIPAELEKGHQDRLLPMAPEFAEFLLATPEAERKGRVFRPRSQAGKIPGADRVSRLIGRMGKAANVKVYEHPKTGGVKFASAHDLRRSFGERWAMRVTPQVLMVLMRHENIQTTMRFYVGRNALVTADAAWDAYEQQNGSGTETGTVAPEITSAEAEKETASPLQERACGE